MRVPIEEGSLSREMLFEKVTFYCVHAGLKS
jgi:hypothetical protein